MVFAKLVLANKRSKISEFTSAQNRFLAVPYFSTKPGIGFEYRQGRAYLVCDTHRTQDVYNTAIIPIQ